ncbi:MAG: glycosyltransferase family 2 protein [Phycisphaerae bacterium]|nr:glycosyltransferase family 2 protein [Phycisphaerae bacterium]
MAEPIATVVIPNYNGMRFLPRLIDSLNSQSESRFKVTIVDDGSSDESVEYLRQTHGRIHLIVNERNLGFTGSCNAGMRAARSPFVVLLNNDTHVDSDWMAQGLQAFDSADVASVASLVVMADPPHLIDTAGDVYSVAGGAVKRNHLMPRETAGGLSRDCFSASGASAFFRRDCVERVGLLDEAFESYYEDVDLGFRLAHAGYRCRFAPRSICYHHLSSSYSPTGWRYHFNSARNAEIVWQADLPQTLQHRHRHARRLFLMLQGANKLRQGCFRAWYAGRRAAKSSSSWIAAKRLQSNADDPARIALIESRLTKNWWGLHVFSRFTKNALVGGTTE